MSPFAPSGEQWTITDGDRSATVVGIGGGLREFTAGDRPVLAGYDVTAKADGGRGQVLMPWPNRLRDGHFTFDGATSQLALTEPARGNASHGLVRWAPWHVVERDVASVTVGFRLMPQPGWDHPLDLTVTYALTDDGLTVTPSATALGDRPAPFGFGAHPYLTVGEEQVDDLTLTVPADTVLEVDDRLIPVGRSAVPPDLDFRSPRTVGETVIDHAFTDLTAADERWEVAITGGGATTTLWADAAAFPYAQVFTGDTLAQGRRRRTGVAVEPMTCPANALATGESLLVLEPGETWSATWGITHR